MDFKGSTPSLARVLPGCYASDNTVSQRIGEVTTAAPASDRGRLLEYLLKPLGALTLVAVADSVFTKLRFRGAWPDLHARMDDVSRVQPGDITALVDRVQQVSGDAVDRLASIVSASPVIASSAAAALLVAVLMQRDRVRRAAQHATGDDPDFQPPL